MKYRHEWKHEISEADRLLLLKRLPVVMQRDSHAVGGRYHIRSLYFDSYDNKALREKVDGLNVREKFRIRYYNNDLSYIMLEKKSKNNGLTGKVSCRLTKEEAQKIVDGDTAWMSLDARPLCRELRSKMQMQGLRPRTIVDYTRDPFVYGPGNVRVTMDYDVRTAITNVDFLNPDTITLPAGHSPIILEVKWDEYLPDIIRSAVSLESRHVGSFSKYEQCRIYG